MTPYYEGTSEAEHLIRATPQLVEAWLKKAKQDRRRLATRLFQPQKKEFLDGFIFSLEGHLEQRASREDSGAGSGTDLLAVAAVVDVEDPPVPDEPAAEPVKKDQPAEVSPAPVDDETAAEVRLSAGQEETDSGSARFELDTETEMAMGFMRISGWAVEGGSDSSDLSEQGDAASGRLDDASIQTGGPVPAIEWNRVFERARGVGMVDLSAYDFIDGLGELRDLIDRWQNLHQDGATVDNP